MIHKQLSLWQKASFLRLMLVCWAEFQWQFLKFLYAFPNGFWGKLLFQNKIVNSKLDLQKKRRGWPNPKDQLVVVELLVWLTYAVWESENFVRAVDYDMKFLPCIKFWKRTTMLMYQAIVLESCCKVKRKCWLHLLLWIVGELHERGNGIICTQAG